MGGAIPKKPCNLLKFPHIQNVSAKGVKKDIIFKCGLHLSILTFVCVCNRKNKYNNLFLHGYIYFQAPG